MKARTQKQGIKWDPHSWIERRNRGTVLAIMILASLALTFALSAIGASLKNDVARYGIVSLELAASKARAREIIDSWASRAREDAFLSIGLDYLYLCIYPISISLACGLIAGRIRDARPALAKLGAVLSRAVIGALVLDAIENYAMIQMLRSSESEFWPRLAWFCAIPKFALVVVGLAYVLAGLGVMALLKFKRPASDPA